jgi:hypothetical protein
MISIEVWGIAVGGAAAVNALDRWQRMKRESYGELRYVACKNVDCSESIPLPDRTLLEPTAHHLTRGAVFPPVYFACMQCGHVYGYIPSEVRNHGAGHMLDQDPEMELHHRAIELLCGSDCKAPATIHIPTYVDDEIVLMAQVSQLTPVNVFCKHGQRIAAVPKEPHMLRYG